jgi:hypothetical protein
MAVTRIRGQRNAKHLKTNSGSRTKIFNALVPKLDPFPSTSDPHNLSHILAEFTPHKELYLGYSSQLKVN